MAGVSCVLRPFLKFNSQLNPMLLRKVRWTFFLSACQSQLPLMRWTERGLLGFAGYCFHYTQRWKMQRFCWALSNNSLQKRDPCLTKRWKWIVSWMNRSSSQSPLLLLGQLHKMSTIAVGNSLPSVELFENTPATKHDLRSLCQVTSTPPFSWRNLRKCWAKFPEILRPGFRISWE